MKKITLAVILTLLANIFCLPLWTDCDYVGFVRTLFNKETSLRLIYNGMISRAAPFNFESTPKPLNNTSYFYRSDNQCHSILKLRVRENWQKLSLSLKALEEGKITVMLEGQGVFDECGNSRPVLTDWRNFKINGSVIFDDAKTLSYKTRVSRQVSVKRNEILHVEAEFRRHHFGIRDFTFLRHGNLWFFITGNLLSFFLIYRLADYIRGGGIRIGDSLLLSAFFICCVIPMIFISDGVRNTREDRMLTVKPELKEIFKERSDYGRRYENWFNDHFGGRPELIKSHDAIRNAISKIIRTRKANYFKENAWIFRKPFIPNLDCKAPFLQSIAMNLVSLNKFCQQHQIKFYVMEVPKKELVYKDVIANSFGLDEKLLMKKSRAQEVIRNEMRRHHIPYVYPYKALRDASKQDFVFFKLSLHWTDWGAFTGYRELMKEINKDFPDMPVVSLENCRKLRSRYIREFYDESYNFGELNKLFNYEDSTESLGKDFYNYYDHKDGNKMVMKITKFTKDFTYPKGRRRVMLIGTSQNENLNHFLPYSAAETKYIRLNMGQVKTADEFKVLKLYKKDILAFRPDILIICIYTDDLPRLRDLCSTK